MYFSGLYHMKWGKNNNNNNNNTVPAHGAPGVRLVHGSGGLLPQQLFSVQETRWGGGNNNNKHLLETRFASGVVLELHNNFLRVAVLVP